MALADYYLCDVCQSKCFYDTDVDYDWNTGSMRVLCNACSEGFKVVVVDKDADVSRYEEKAKETAKNIAEEKRLRFLKACEESERRRREKSTDR